MATFPEHQVTIIDTAELARLRDELATLRAKADAARNDAAERQRIAGDKVLSCSVTPGFGIMRDKYEVNGKPATREQYLLAVLSVREEQAAELRSDVERLKALCDEGATKMAELRKEKESLHSKLAWYQMYRTEPSAELDSLRNLLRNHDDVCATLRGKTEAAERQAEEWHGLYTGVVNRANKFLEALESILAETMLDTEHPWILIGRIQSIAREATK